MAVQTQPHSKILPPPDPPGPIKWLRDNFFGTVLNSILTVISGIIVYFVVTAFFRWAITQANWEPVTQSTLLFAIGQYPREHLWRVGAGLGLIAFMIGLSWGKWGKALRLISVGMIVGFLFLSVFPAPQQITPEIRIFLVLAAGVVGLGYWLGKQSWISGSFIGIVWFLTPIIAIVLLNGIDTIPWLATVSTTLWGGLIVTFILAAGGILLSFPIGVGLALGRRSNLPVLKAFSIAFIEGVRGVPLITILFMFSFILALFLPSEARIDRLVRALMAMTLFSAAYMAENIRGGLQSIPPGQIEAGRAIGMSNAQTMVFIVLPQALRAVIPSIVGQFISLFKDTTLVVIVGINDLLGIGKAIIGSKPEWIQLDLEVYLFISLIYWVLSYIMSQASRRLETRLGVGLR